MLLFLCGKSETFELCQWWSSKLCPKFATQKNSGPSSRRWSMPTSIKGFGVSKETFRLSLNVPVGTGCRSATRANSNIGPSRSASTQGVVATDCSGKNSCRMRALPFGSCGDTIRCIARQSIPNSTVLCCLRITRSGENTCRPTIGHASVTSLAREQWRARAVAAVIQTFRYQIGGQRNVGSIPISEPTTCPICEKSSDCCTAATSSRSANPKLTRWSKTTEHAFGVAA